MSKEIRTVFLGAAGLAASLAVGAQIVAPAPSRPAAPAAVQAAPYSSAFESYRPFSADEPGDWRKANDTVREIGGWRAYARQIQASPQVEPRAAARPAPAAPAAPAGPAAPPNPHQGHAR